MDKVIKQVVDSTDQALMLYHIKELMTDHSLTLEQVFHLLCILHNIESVVAPGVENALYNKGLLRPGNKVNQTLLLHLKTGTQLEMNLNFSTEAVGTDFTLDIADRIEKVFTCDEFLTATFRKKTADMYFKGDLTLARYFLIFRSLFPVKDKKRNARWNTKFGFIYDGIGLWDTKPNVAKKFAEIFRKQDIGVFLEALFSQVRDATNFEEGKTYMTKPYKFLVGSKELYEDTLAIVTARETRMDKISSTKQKLNV